MWREQLPVIKNISRTCWVSSLAEIRWFKPQQGGILSFCSWQIGFVKLRHTHTDSQSHARSAIRQLKLTNSDRYNCSCQRCRKDTHIAFQFGNMRAVKWEHEPTSALPCSQSDSSKYLEHISCKQRQSWIPAKSPKTLNQLSEKLPPSSSPDNTLITHHFTIAHHSLFLFLCFCFCSGLSGLQRTCKIFSDVFQSSVKLPAW